jgi:hypothetical protein
LDNPEVEMKELGKLEATNMGRSKLDTFLQPTRTKVILAVVLYPILLTLMFYYIMQIDYVSKNQLLETIGFIVNVIPILLIWLVGILTLNYEVPFPMEFMLIITAYFIVPGLWAYFMSCIVTSLLSALKSEKSK